MRYEPLVAAAFAGIAAAHGSFPGAPQILGGRKLMSAINSLKRAPIAPRYGPADAPPALEKRAELPKRQNNDVCGAGVGSCAEGLCCSAAGFCGTGKDYCAAPDCQQNYGPACDANQRPSGVDTSGADRTHIGGVTYSGAGIYDCVNPGDIAITFDDGPYSYTSDLLDKLAAYNAKATFFITGNNLGKGMINDPSTPYRAMIARMYAEGHQIASHTWSHQNSSQTSAQQWRDQMIYNEIALNDILGFFPTYMRPPYSICEAQCQGILSELGYHITYFDLDTEGYLHNDPNEIQASFNILDNALANSNPANDAWLHIEHDIQDIVVYTFMDYMLGQLQEKGWNMVTVGECLGDPEQNWYRTVGGSTPPGNGSDVVSTDGTCGNGITCLGSEFGDCCSQYGWCGSGSDYCSNCQPEWGSACDGSSTSTMSATPTSTSTSTPTPTPSGDVSTDGTCGNGVTCLGSTFGNCCSQYGWCGSTDGHCGDGCNTAWGTCNGGSGSQVSTDGTCGNGVTCLGSSFGNCCSQYGWCGSTTGHCGTGCQSGFGTCS